MLSLFLVFVVFNSVFSYPRHVDKTLTVHNGGGWGDWEDEEFCATGYYANGYSMKIEDRQGRGDDTSLNIVALRCTNPSNFNSFGGQITSGQGSWGNWTGWIFCSKENYITSFNLQAEPGQGRGDDTAANFIKFKCRDLPKNKDEKEMVLSPGEGFWGSYGGWSESCPENTAVCGIQTRIESPKGKGDDTALNDVKLFCCS